MKRAIIVNHYAYAPDQGAGTRHFEAARYLRTRGYSPVVVSCGFFHKKREHREGTGKARFRTELVDGVRFVWIKSTAYRGNGPKRVLNLLVFAFYAWIAVRSLARRCAFVVGSSPQPFAALAAYVVAASRKIPFCYEIRDLWPQTFLDMGKAARFNPLVVAFGVIEKLLLRRADCVVALLPRIERYFERIRCRPRRLVWVPNGLRREVVDGLGPPARNARGDGVLRIAYAGVHGPAQNLGQVLRAAKLLQERNSPARFDFIGGGPEKEGLQALASELGLDTVTFHAPVPKHEVAAKLSAADALLLPLVDAKVLEYGISPNKLFDYMGAARPIVYFGPVAASPLRDGVEGVVAAGTEPVHLADAVERLCALPEERREALGCGARDLLVRDYVLDRNFDRWLAVVEGL